jgi:hypothetical protein
MDEQWAALLDLYCGDPPWRAIIKGHLEEVLRPGEGLAFWQWHFLDRPVPDVLLN